MTTIVCDFRALLSIFTISVSRTVGGQVGNAPSCCTGTLLRCRRNSRLAIHRSKLTFKCTRISRAGHVVARISCIRDASSDGLSDGLMLGVTANAGKRLRTVPTRRLIPVGTCVNGLGFTNAHVRIVSAGNSILIPHLAIFCSNTIPRTRVCSDVRAHVQSCVVNVSFSTTICISHLASTVHHTRRIASICVSRATVPRRNIFVTYRSASKRVRPLRHINHVACATSNCLGRSSHGSRRSRLPAFQRTVALGIRGRRVWTTREPFNRPTHTTLPIKATIRPLHTRLPLSLTGPRQAIPCIYAKATCQNTRSLANRLFQIIPRLPIQWVRRKQRKPRLRRKRRRYQYKPMPQENKVPTSFRHVMRQKANCGKR